MRDRNSGWGAICTWIAAGTVLLAGGAAAHPGGTPVGVPAPGIYCATCHASTATTDFEGQAAKAESELAETKHLSAIRAGIGTYQTLSDADRERLATLIESVDRNSQIRIEAPASVAPGARFEVNVVLTGGAGPTVAVGLFDRPHRLFARPIATKGFELIGDPRVSGGRLRATAAAGKAKASPAPVVVKRVPTLFDIEGVSSSAEADRWAKVEIVFELQAPAEPGEYPIIGAYLYGTEKAVKLSTRTDDSRFPPFPLGGETAASGRVKFSAPQVLRVGSALSASD
ncbi:MAG: hypothetical protein R3F21_01525 [Myxococcota bacterium]